MKRHQFACAAAIATLVSQSAGAVTAEMDIGDTTLPYVSEGEGAPVVFVHGAISDLRAWDPYREMISDDRRFVAYSQRYFGTGEWPDDGENFQRATHVRDLVAFVEGLDSGPVHLVTWSYSGEIGIHAMLERPDLFRSAVHFEPVLDRIASAAPGGANAAQDLFSHFGPAVGAAQENRGEDAALRFIEAVFRLPDGAAEGEEGEEMWRQNGRTVAPYLAMDAPAPIDCATLHRITSPTLVVQGAKSFTWYSIMAERIGSCVANGIVLTLPESTHDGPYRRPAEFGAMIESFLSLID